MEPEGSLPHSQVPATCPYPEPDRSSPSHFLKLHLNIILPPISGSSKWPHSLRFPHQNSVCTSTLPPYAAIHYIFVFLQIISRCAFKLKDSKIFLRFPSSKHNNICLLYFDNMFRPTDHHQAISIKLKTRCNAGQIIFSYYRIR